MGGKKHILVISQYFYPEQFRINDIATELVNRGYQVTVLTGIPNYPEGRFYKGYSWFSKRQEPWNGVDIIRIPLFARGKRAIGLVLNYCSFVFFGFFWSHFTKVKADLVFSFEVSPMTQVKIGCWFSKRRKIPHYLYVQDLWPENVEIMTGIHNPIVIKPIRRMVKMIYKQCTVILATSLSFVEDIKKYVEDKDKVLFWPQYAEDFYRPVDKYIAKAEAQKYGIPNDDSFKVIFTGNVGYAQGLDILPKTAELLKEKCVTDIKFVIVGNGRFLNQLMQEIEKAGVKEYFIFVPKQPPANIPVLLSACNTAFLSFTDNDLWKKTIPAKFQSYIACGMPIVASAEGEVTRIIEDADCGFSCSFGDANGLTQIIEKSKGMDLSKLSRNSLEYSVKRYNRTMLITELMNIMEI